MAPNKRREFMLKLLTSYTCIYALLITSFSATVSAAEAGATTQSASSTATPAANAAKDSAINNNSTIKNLSTTEKQNEKRKAETTAKKALAILKFNQAIEKINLPLIFDDLSTLDSLTQELQRADEEMMAVSKQMESNNNATKAIENSTVEIDAKTDALTQARDAAQKAIDECNNNCVNLGELKGNLRIKQGILDRHLMNVAKIKLKQSNDLKLSQDIVRSTNATADIKAQNMEQISEKTSMKEAQIYETVKRNMADAVIIAKESKEIAFSLLGSINNTKYKVSQKLKDKTVAEDYIKQLASASAIVFNLECKKEDYSEIESPVYYLLQAAAAIFLYVHIYEADDYNKNSEDIVDLDATTEMDTQRITLAKATMVAKETYDASKSKADSMEMYKTMLQHINDVNQAEIQMKTQFVATAKANLQAKKNHLKEVEQRIMIFAAILATIYTTIYFLQGVEKVAQATATACAGTLNWPCVVAAMAIWKGAVISEVAFWAQVIIISGIAAILLIQKIKAEEAVDKAKKKLKVAENFTHEKCTTKTTEKIPGIGVTSNPSNDAGVVIQNHVPVDNSSNEAGGP